jgi:hypothetical protein
MKNLEESRIKSKMLQKSMQIKGKIMSRQI